MRWDQSRSVRTRILITFVIEIVEVLMREGTRNGLWTRTSATNCNGRMKLPATVGRQPEGDKAGGEGDR